MYKDNIFMIAYHILKSYILKTVLPSQSDKKPLLCQFISLHNNYYKILLLSTRNNLISIFGLSHGSFKNDVYCVDWYLCRGNVPECGTSQYIGTVSRKSDTVHLPGCKFPQTPLLILHR